MQKYFEGPIDCGQELDTLESGVLPLMLLLLNIPQIGANPLLHKIRQDSVHVAVAVILTASYTQHDNLLESRI